jgi:hypothetical protein
MSQTFDTDSVVETRTRSVPAAGHLVCMGYTPLGVVKNTDGTKAIRFPASAREALENFMTAKVRIDQLLETIK